jgi:CRP-like cAMP-binding protein
MSQMQNWNIAELKIKLINQGEFSEQSWFALIQAVYPNRPQGRLYRVDQIQKYLEIRDLASGELLPGIALAGQSEPPQNFSSSGESWGECLILLDPAQGTLVEQRQYLKPLNIGLAVTEKGSALVAPDWEFDSDWAAASSLYGNYLPRGKQEHGPYDLSVSELGDLLFIVDRSQGQLSIFAIPSHDLLAHFQIRKTASLNSINLAVDSLSQRAFITDNESSVLYSLDLETMVLTHLQPGLGILGNLCMDPQDQRFLFVLTIKPEIGLVYLDTLTWEIIRRVPLKGRLFSRESDLPTELISLSKQASLLTLMTYSNDPLPLTPLFEVLNTSAVKMTRRFKQKNSAYPSALAQLQANPWYQNPESLLGALAERGLLTEIPAPQEHAQLPTTLDDLDLRFRGLTLTGSLDSDAAPRIFLPPEAETEILDILLGGIFQQTGIQVQDYPQEMRKLSELLPDLREKLETRWDVTVDFAIFDRHPVHLAILREALIQLLQLRLAVNQGIAETPPDNCPFCGAMLLGLWDCRSCGFELLSPERELARRLASAEPTTHLLPGQLLFTQADAGRVVVLDYRHQPLLSLELEQTEQLFKPVSAVALPNGHFLIADAATSQILEVSPTNAIIWQTDPLLTVLSQPVWATFYQEGAEIIFLIVDQADHRCLAIDSEQKIRWQYGVKGLSGIEQGYLKAPQSIQHTPDLTWLIADTGNQRVLEIAHDGQIKKTWGAKQGLKQPIWARRLAQGETWILDTGRKALLVYDFEQVLVREVDWDNALLDAISAPSLVYRQTRGDLILADSQCGLEMDSRHGRLNWCLNWAQIAAEKLAHLRPAAAHSVNPLVVRTELLRSLPFFKDAEIPALIQLARRLRPVSILAGEWVFREGDIGLALFLVEKGNFKASRSDREGILAEFGPGDVFGEMALVLGEKRSSSVVATMPSHLLKLEQNDFDAIMAKYPVLLSQIQALAQTRKNRLQALKNEQSRLAVENLKRRIALARIKKLNLLADADEAFFTALSAELHNLAFKRGQWIFRQGEPGQALYFINRGRIEVLNESTGEVIVELPEGAVLGEMALLDDRPRSASARCKSYAELYRLERSVFLELLERFPSFERKLKAVIEKRKEAAIEAEPVAEIQAQELGQSTGLELAWVHTLSNQLWLLSDQTLRWYPQAHEALELMLPSSLNLTPEHTFLLADSGHDRVLELDKTSLKVLAEFGDETLALNQPQSACRGSDGITWIADTGNQRVLCISAEKTEPLASVQPLEEPVHLALEGKNLLCCDAAADTIYLFEPNGQVLRSVNSITGLSLNRPRYVQVLDNGHWLIADTGNNRVIEINAKNEVVWSYAGSPDMPLKAPDFCQRLADGRTVIFFGPQQDLLCLEADQQLEWAFCLNRPV